MPRPSMLPSATSSSSWPAARTPVPRSVAVTSVGLAVLLATPMATVHAQPAPDRTGLAATASSGPQPSAAVPAPAPAPAALAPSLTNAFVAISQATTARQQAERHRALLADRADRTKKRIARTKAVQRDRAARIKARKERARQWTTPTASGRVTAAFGISGSRWSSGRHTGCDFDGSTGDPVRAVHSGVVIFAGDDGRYGNHVKIRHSNGDETWYAHLSRITVRSGQQVTTRDLVGRVGNTGNSFGSHLHFEVHLDGAQEASDPVRYLREQGLSL